MDLKLSKMLLYELLIFKLQTGRLFNFLRKRENARLLWEFFKPIFWPTSTYFTSHTYTLLHAAMVKIAAARSLQPNKSKLAPGIICSIALIAVLSSIYNNPGRVTSVVRNVSPVAPTPPRAGDQGDEPSDFALAKRESLGFFDDVPASHWELLKKKVQDMSPNYNTWAIPHMNVTTGEKRGDNRNKRFGYFYQVCNVALIAWK